MRIGLLAPLVLLCGAAVARAQAPAGDFTVDTANSSLTYHLVHKMHKVDGTSHKVEGKARVLPDGKAQVMIRVPAQSFDSGNVNRDEHMKEAVEAAKYPTIELKAIGDGIAAPKVLPESVRKVFKAQITFHGVTQTMDVPVEITWESPTKARVESTFTISLDSFKVERPSLMFVKVDDALKIDAKLALAK